MDLVRAVASHVIALQAGVILMVGAPAEVLDSARFRVAVVGGTHTEEPLSQESAGDGETEPERS